MLAVWNVVWVRVLRLVSFFVACQFDPNLYEIDHFFKLGNRAC